MPEPKRIIGFSLVLLCLLALVPGPAPARAQEAPMATRWEMASLPGQPGQPRQVMAILWIEPNKDWHFYAHDPGATGMPTIITAQILPGGVDLAVHYPWGKKTKDALEPDLVVNVHDEATPFFIPIPVLPGDGSVTVKAGIELLLCTSGSCWPVQTEVRQTWNKVILATLPWAETQPWWKVWECAVRDVCPQGQTPPSATNASPVLEDLELKARDFSPGLAVGGLGKAMVFALLAGFILNFMPCVLPVLALKLRAFIPRPEDMGKSSSFADFRAHNLYFALGILIFFFVLSVLLSATGMAWGQLFQNPLAVLIMATVLFALSMSLFDVYYLPIINIQGKGLGRQTNLRVEALTSGMMVTLLATPCSGPFLGSVLAWSLLQPPLVIAVVFLCIGLGMATPYMLLAAYPRLYNYFPKPGNWMIQLERIVGFLILATCIYLLTFLPDDYFIPALFFLWGGGMAAWIWGQWAKPTMTRTRIYLIRAMAVILALIIGFLAKQFYAPRDIGWETFTPELFAELHGQENLLLDFTAEWCPNCKFLEKTVLSPRELIPLREEYGLRTLRVDITHESPASMALLRKLGSQSIPVVAIFPKGTGRNNPVVLRDLFSANQLREAARQALE